MVFVETAAYKIKSYALVSIAILLSATTSSMLYAAQEKKDWTFIVYMAADNDLRGFAARNIRQMANIGSNENLNILVHLDIRISGNKKITRRYYIEKNRILHINANDPTTQRMDSGDPKTLISCCEWGIENYPANHYALILWNHGTGPCDPQGAKIFNATELFSFNPAISKLQLDRNIGFLDFISRINEDRRGICWDDSTGNYLTNQKLDSSLNEICTKYLSGKKLDILGFDACLMAMIEICNIAKKHAHIMVGSQEVELGAGWNYQHVLSPFQSKSPEPKEFATHIVQMFQLTYKKITDDYTQSAVNLDAIDQLEASVNNIAGLLLEALKRQHAGSVKKAINASRHKDLCTHFDEPSYIDLHHLLANLQTNLKHFSLTNAHDENILKSALEKEVIIGQEHIKNIVISSVAGKNLSKAQGISIYFPDRRIHQSYRKTPFAASNDWINLLNQYVNL